MLLIVAVVFSCRAVWLVELSAGCLFVWRKAHSLALYKRAASMWHAIDGAMALESRLANVTKRAVAAVKFQFRFAKRRVRT